jgi:hypothetical protein
MAKRLLEIARLWGRSRGSSIARGGRFLAYRDSTRTKQERPEFEMAVFHKRVNQNIRLENSRTLNCSLSANYSFPWAIGPVLAEPNPLKEA